MERGGPCNRTIRSLVAMCSFSRLFSSLSLILSSSVLKKSKVWRVRSLCFFVFRKHFARVCVNTGRRRERRESRSSLQKKRKKKKKEKTRSRHALCEVSLKKRKEEKEVLFYRQTVVKLFRKVHSQRAPFYPLSSSPEHTHILRHQTRTREE